MARIPAGRRAHREPDLEGARLHDRQCLRHGRRARDHAGDARRGRAAAEDRRHDAGREHRGRQPAGRALCRRLADIAARHPACRSAPIPRSTTGASAIRSCCARRTRRRWRPQSPRRAPSSTGCRASEEARESRLARAGGASCRRQAFPGLLGPVPSRRPRACLAAVRRRAVRSHCHDHPRRPRAGGDRRARARHPRHRDDLDFELS